MWAGKLRMRMILYKTLKAKISIIWKIPNLRLFPTVYDALGDPKLYSRSSRHYSSSEDDFQFSWGAAKREFQTCLLPKSLFGYRIYTAVRVETTNRLRINFTFSHLEGGGVVNGNPKVVSSQMSIFRYQNIDNVCVFICAHENSVCSFRVPKSCFQIE